MNTFFEEKSSRNVCRFKKNRYLCIAFERDANMVDVVQWLERQIVVLNVAGSSPVFHPTKKRKFNNEFPLLRYISGFPENYITLEAGSKPCL